MHYDEFLKSWNPSKLLDYTTLNHNVNDPFLRQQLVNDSTAESDVMRTQNSPGRKSITEDEARVIFINYYKDNKKGMECEFHTRMKDAGVPSSKLDQYYRIVLDCWCDGRSKRTRSDEIKSLEMSLLYYDRELGNKAFVKNALPCDIDPLFNVKETCALLHVNMKLMELFIDDYIADCGVDISSDSIWIRRGMFIKKSELLLYKEFELIELRYLTSYSFSITVAEQFAQTSGTGNMGAGLPIIVSIPICEYIDRLVIFSLFIPGMPVDQVEIVVAPPCTSKILRDTGPHGEIYDRAFIWDDT